MSLETYTGYIPSLVVTNPTATDPKSQGDDHLRGVKRTLAVTFSGFTEPDVAVTVKASQINSAVQDGLSFVPAGAINIWPAAAAPTGWLLSQGQAVSRTTYAKLFAVIGTTYGVGDGSTTFNLPDLRGYFVRGLDAGRGVDTGRVLGSGQAGDNAPHNHSGTTSGGSPHGHTGTTGAAGSHQHYLKNANGYSGSVSSREVQSYNDTVPGNGQLYNTNPAGDHSHAFTTTDESAHTHTITVSTTGVEARPINIALNYIIKV